MENSVLPRQDALIIKGEGFSGKGCDKLSVTDSSLPSSPLQVVAGLADSNAAPQHESLKIVELGSDILEMEEELKINALICHFHNFSPSLAALREWIVKNWDPLLSRDPVICPCARDFFVVVCHSSTDRHKLLQGDPWSWGKANLRLKPWFPEFNPLTETFEVAPVWVRMHNLPIQFWFSSCLSSIGNSLGKTLAIPDSSRRGSQFSFARILVEMDLSKSLPPEIGLKVEDRVWKQQLDYEDIAFRCKSCFATGHLAHSCPRTSGPAKKNKHSWHRLNESHQHIACDLPAPPAQAPLQQSPINLNLSSAPAMHAASSSLNKSSESSLQSRLSPASALIMKSSTARKKSSPKKEAEPRKMALFPKIVHFRRLDKPKEDDFCLELSELYTYDYVVDRVAHKLGLDDPFKIRLTAHDCCSQQPKPQPFKYSGVDHLSDMLVHYNQTSDILYYEVLPLDIPLPELQGLKSLEVEFHHSTKDEVSVHAIRLPKQSTVGDVINDLKTKVDLSNPDAEIRLLEIFDHKIHKIFPLHEKIENINDQCWTLRAEEIPEEEKNLGPHNRLIHVYHFTKDAIWKHMQVQNFGEPFCLLIHEVETLAEVKQRIQKKMQVSDDEFAKWKFAFLTFGRCDYLQDTDTVSSCIQRRDVYGFWEQCIGLEHSDNAPKRSDQTNQKHNLFEKPVRI